MPDQSERSIKVQGINKTIEHEDPSVIDTQSFNADLSDISTIHTPTLCHTNDNFREHNLNSKKLKIVMPPRNTRTAAKASGESKIPTAAGTSGPSKSGSSSIPTKLSLPSTRARKQKDITTEGIATAISQGLSSPVKLKFGHSKPDASTTGPSGQS